MLLRHRKFRSRINPERGWDTHNQQDKEESGYSLCHDPIAFRYPATNGRSDLAFFPVVGFAYRHDIHLFSLFPCALADIHPTLDSSDGERRVASKNPIGFCRDRFCGQFVPSVFPRHRAHSGGDRGEQHLL